MTPAELAVKHCSGCGAAFTRNPLGRIVHPEPWCNAMLNGEERPK